jgi:hypothetical protein
MRVIRFRTRRALRSPGQALVEFAIAFPVLFLLVAGIIQFGLIFWSQNTLTQIARDTGRWASTQQDCTDAGPVIATANAIAAQSSLLGYTTDSWTGANVVVSWPNLSGPCPPENNQQVSFVRISITHQIPIFFPLVPGNGNLSTSAEFRMEPMPK